MQEVSNVTPKGETTMRTIIFVCLLTSVMLIALAFAVQAEDVHMDKSPFAPKRVQRIETTLCRTHVQIREIARLTNLGNSPEVALMDVNSGLSVERCERVFVPVWEPTLVEVQSTDFHLIATFRVMTAKGRRFMFLAKQRFSI